MKNKFDELTKSLAQSTTRRGAFKQFVTGLGGIALATVTMVKKTYANGQRCHDCVEACIAAGNTAQYCRDHDCGLVCHKGQFP